MRTRKLALAGLALALAAGTWGTAQALKWVQSEDLTYVKLATTDSTSIALTSGDKDTTAWYDMARWQWANPGIAGLPALAVEVTSSAASGDTMGVQVQYSANGSTVQGSVTEKNYIDASPVTAFHVTWDAQATDAASGWRFYRAILNEKDVTRTAAYTGVKTRIFAVVEHR